MQSVRFIGFGMTTAVTRTLLHFFPSAGNVTAPYQANVRLTVSGNGVATGTVMLEGARLSQPDGVRLEMAFPHLQSETGALFALEVEISTMQPRVDMTASECIVELSSVSRSARYRPVQIDQTEPPLPCLAVRDAFNSSSLVVINPTDVIQHPRVERATADGPLLMRLDPVAPKAVQEINFDEATLAGAPHECSWGLTRCASVKPLVEPNSVLRYFLLYRDSITKTPVSVVAI